MAFCSSRSAFDLLADARLRVIWLFGPQLGPCMRGMSSSMLKFGACLTCYEIARSPTMGGF